MKKLRPCYKCGISYESAADYAYYSEEQNVFFCQRCDDQAHEQQIAQLTKELEKRLKQ